MLHYGLPWHELCDLSPKQIRTPRGPEAEHLGSFEGLGSLRYPGLFRAAMSGRDESAQGHGILFAATDGATCRASAVQSARPFGAVRCYT
eukprot:s87_g31.t1